MHKGHEGFCCFGVGLGRVDPLECGMRNAEWVLIESSGGGFVLSGVLQAVVDMIEEFERESVRAENSKSKQNRAA